MSDVNPVNYRIHLEPDLKHFTFSGKVDLLVESVEPVREITLNALELALWACSVKVDETFIDCPFKMDPDKEEVKITLPKEMSGEIELAIDYMGKINDRMAGFYRSRTVVDGREQFMAVTQFEESDARRAFPCFDHPRRKAFFDIEMIVEKGLSAISNGPIIEEEPYGDGRKRIKFKQTPKMSTYLLFFGVGDFEFIEDPGDVLVRVATQRGMSKQGRFGLEFGRKSLEFSEDYYGIRYPLQKLDLIAIADFAAGAMENWGAITFRENLLLHDPDKTSRAGEVRICEVIAHEMAHQWFGNLVTPSDWKYLWLNESFATYFGYGIVDHYHPEWEIWDQFLHGQTHTALERDALNETFPIEIPGGEHVVINASTAPIIYNKGGSILRQVEGYIGAENLKAGLRVYLKEHAYDNAASRHLWEALEKVSSRPISQLMKSWIGQPGFPLVELKRDGEKLVVSQKRFTYLPGDSQQKWLIPLTIKVFLRNNDTKSITVLLENEETVIDINDALAYKANEGETGFYRVHYTDHGNLAELGARMADQTLSPVDRWGLQDDFYAMVKGGLASLEEYLDFLSFYSKEDAFLPLTGVADNVYHAHLIVEEQYRERTASFGRSFLEGVLKRIGYEPRIDENLTTSILRDQIMWHAALYGSGEANAFGLEKFRELIKGEKIHPDIAKSIMKIGALKGEQDAFEWFDKRINTSESEHERMNILLAMGSFSDKGMIEEAETYILEQVPDRNKFVPIAALASNPHAIPGLWTWYVSNLEAFEGFHPMHYERVITSIVPIGGIGREEEVRAFFEDYMKKKERARDVIKLSLERLEINARMRKSASATPV